MRRALPIAAILAAIAILVLAPSVGAFTLNGCTMVVQSSGPDGSALDAASGPGAAGTEADPLIVDWNGTVNWSGTTGSQVIKKNSWHVEVFYIPTSERGNSANDGGDTSGDGTINVKDNAPFRFTGLYFVSGAISGDGGSCDGSGWVKVAGDPVGTLPFFVGLVLALLGVLMLALGVVRGQVLASIVGGLLAGLGVAVLLVISASVPLGAATPLAILAIGIVVGIAAALLGRSRASRPL